MAPEIPIVRLLALAAAGTAAGLAGGCECVDFDWSQSPEFWRPASEQADLVEVPVDAAPWLLRPCTRREAPTDCALVVDGERIPVDVTVVGADACPDDDYYGLEQAYPTVIHTLRPAHPLPAGAFAVLDCADDDDEYTGEYYGFDGSDYASGTTLPPTLHVRADTSSAAAPVDLEILALHYTRNDDESCLPPGDYLALRIDFDAAYLRQGGYLEVIYPDGQALAISRPHAGDTAWLPASRGPLSVTPVSISGERGETRVVDDDDMTEDLVYIPGCAVDPAGDPASLLALAFLAVRRRRRSP